MSPFFSQFWRPLGPARLILKVLPLWWLWCGGLPNLCLAGEGMPVVPTEFLVIGSILGILVLGGLSYLLYTHIKKIPRLLARAQKAMARQNLARAQKNFSRIVSLLEAKEQLSDDELCWLQESHHGLAAVGEAQEQEEVAVAHYVKAYHAGLAVSALSPGGLTLLAGALVATRNLSDRAIEVYLAYLGLEPDPDAAKDVCALLAQVGSFKEDAPHNLKLRAVRVARAVVDADAQQEWAQFSLGVAAVVNGKPDLAIPFLLQAAKLGSERPALYFWMGQACRLKDEPHQEGAAMAFTKFLDLSQAKEEQGKRAVAAFYLGASLVESYGWSWSQDARVPGDQSASLGKAAHWLELALAAGKVDGETYYYLGRAHFLRGLYFEAANALAKAVESAPDNQTYVYASGMVYLALNDRGEAEHSFLQVLKIDPQHQEARRMLARLYTEDSRWPDAEEQCNLLLDVAPPDVEVMVMLIQALYRQEKYEAVVARTEDCRLQTLPADAAPTALFIAQSYSRIHNYQGALGWCQQAQALSPSPVAAYYLAKALGHLERYAEAHQTLAPFLDAESDYRRAAYRLDGDLLFKLGKYTEAVAGYQTALQLSPGDPEILYSLGAAAYNQGDLTQAADFFAQTLKADARHAGALLGEGLLREAQEDIQGAQERYRQVLDLDPQQLTAHERLAILLCKDQQYQDALDHLLRLGAKATESDQALYYLGVALMNLWASSRETTIISEEGMKRALNAWSLLLERRPEDKRLQILTAQLRYALGQRYALQGLYPEAVGAWQQYLQVLPDDGETRTGLAEMLWRTAIAYLNDGPDSYPQAQAAVRQALNLDPQRWQFHYYDALLAMGTGNLEEARSKLELMAEKSPDDSRVQYHLGLVALRQGAPEQALSLWEAAAQNGSGGEYAFRAILAMANERIGHGEYGQAADLLVQAMGPGKQEAEADHE